MLHRYSVNFAVFSILMDMFFVLVSIRLAPSLLHLVTDTIRSFPIIVHVIFPISWGLIFMGGIVYDNRRNIRFLNEMSSFHISISLTLVVFAGFLYFLAPTSSQSVFFVFFVLLYALTLAWRLLSRLYWRSNLSNSKFTRRILIVGMGETGRQVAAQIQSGQELSLNLVGFLDVTSQTNVYPGWLGTIENLSSVVGCHQVDDVVVTLDAQEHALIARIVSELAGHPVGVWIVPDVFRLAVHRAAIGEFAGVPMVDVRAPALNDYQRFTKRVFDIVTGSVIFLAALPVMAIISLLIRFDSPGTIFFCQKRVGENGQLFGMYKFRTMIPDAEAKRDIVTKKNSKGKLLYKTADDPRVTRIGRILRRTSLDELPQLLNVLKGEMSLVGPRPELPYLVELYEPWQMARFSVPQGMTGWWQVNGRSDRPMHLYTEDDLFYICNYSIWLDVFILIKTIGAVVLGRGAY